MLLHEAVIRAIFWNDEANFMQAASKQVSSLEQDLERYWTALGVSAIALCAWDIPDREADEQRAQAHHHKGSVKYERLACVIPTGSAIDERELNTDLQLIFDNGDSSPQKEWLKNENVTYLRHKVSDEIDKQIDKMKGSEVQAFPSVVLGPWGIEALRSNKLQPEMKDGKQILKGIDFKERTLIAPSLYDATSPTAAKVISFCQNGHVMGVFDDDDFEAGNGRANAADKEMPRGNVCLLVWHNRDESAVDVGNKWQEVVQHEVTIRRELEGKTAEFRHTEEFSRWTAEKIAERDEKVTALVSAKDERVRTKCRGLEVLSASYGLKVKDALFLLNKGLDGQTDVPARQRLDVELQALLLDPGYHAKDFQQIWTAEDQARNRIHDKMIRLQESKELLRHIEHATSNAEDLDGVAWWAMYQAECGLGRALCENRCVHAVLSWNFLVFLLLTMLGVGLYKTLTLQ